MPVCALISCPAPKPRPRAPRQHIGIKPQQDNLPRICTRFREFCERRIVPAYLLVFDLGRSVQHSIQVREIVYLFLHLRGNNDDRVVVRDPICALTKRGTIERSVTLTNTPSLASESQQPSE